MVKQFLILFAVVCAPLFSWSGNGIERFVGIDFSQAADISERAKDRLSTFVNTNCQMTSLDKELVSAKLVNLNRVRVDQGVIDETYVVKISMLHTMDEEFDVVSDLVELTLTDYAGSNPSVEWVQIEGVKNFKQDFCR